MSVEIRSRQICPTGPSTAAGAYRIALPWAIAALMAAYIVGSQICGRAPGDDDLAPLDPPAARTAGALERLGETARRVGGQIVLVGSVRNRSRRPLNDIEAIVEFYDRHGRLVALAHGLPTDRRIAPGASTAYEAYADDSADVAGYRIRFRHLGGASIGP